MEDKNIVVLDIDSIEEMNTPVDDFENEYVFLLSVAIDTSSSMYPYSDVMKDSLATFKTSMDNSKEAENVLIARSDFSSNITVGGYKPINEFDTSYSPYGMTALYDVIVEQKENLVQYMNYLKAEGTRTKAVFAVFSDGDDTSSMKHSMIDAKEAIRELNKLEITTAFIAAGPDAQETAKSLGFINVLEIQSKESDFRFAFDCLSKSVDESSKNIGTSDDDDFFKL